jgi:hypothetical protein
MSHDSDDELAQELALLAAGEDPVPAHVLQAGIDAFSWRDVDSELAELVFDSLLDSDEATLVRSAPGQRLVSFKIHGRTIDLEVTVAGAEREVMGQLTPAEAATVQIRHSAGQVTVTADGLGRFMAALPAGPVSLRISNAAGQRFIGRKDALRPAAVVTDWVSI